MIDWQRVWELRDEVGAENFDEVVDLFLFEVEDELTKLREGGDNSALEARLHFLRGSAMNLGFEAFSQICLAGELAAGNGSDADIHIDNVLKCYVLSKSEFLQRMERIAAA